jgi:hypothetical protein
VEKQSTGQPRGTEEDVDGVRQAFVWRPKKSISRASTELQMRSIEFFGRLTSKTIQITGSPEIYGTRKTAYIVVCSAHVAQILKHDNVLSCIVFTDEAKFYFCGHVSRHKYVI